MIFPRSQPYYLDVTHPDANKVHVVTFLSQVLSIPTEQIATIGDMPNEHSCSRKAVSVLPWGTRVSMCKSRRGS